MVDEQAGQLGIGIGAGHVPHGSVAGTMADESSEPGMTSDAQLARYRASIDNIDAALVHLLAERFKITQDVGRYKAEIGLPPADPVREDLQVARFPPATQVLITIPDMTAEKPHDGLGSAG